MFYNYDVMMEPCLYTGCTVTCGPDRCIPTLESVFTQFPNTPINIDLKVYNETLFEKVICCV